MTIGGESKQVRSCLRVRQGADALSQKIRDMLEAQKEFYVIVQSACKTEQIMDTKMMTN